MITPIKHENKYPHNILKPPNKIHKDDTPESGNSCSQFDLEVPKDSNILAKLFIVLY